MRSRRLERRRGQPHRRWQPGPRPRKRHELDERLTKIIRVGIDAAESLAEVLGVTRSYFHFYGPGIDPDAAVTSHS